MSEHNIYFSKNADAFVICCERHRQVQIVGSLCDSLTRFHLVLFYKWKGMWCAKNEFSSDSKNHTDEPFMSPRPVGSTEASELQKLWENVLTRMADWWNISS